jgi:hypothetical protein
MALRKTTWAILAWTAVWIVGIWALDPAATVGRGGRLPPAWVLFDLWAIGFVVLGAIWNTVRSGTGTGTGSGSSRVRMEDRPVRWTTWAILAWTVLWIVLFGIWALNPGQTFPGEGPGQSRPDIRLKPPDFLLFVFWFVGFAVLSAVWLMTRWRSRGHSKLTDHPAIGGS